MLVLSQYLEEHYAADLLSANTSSVGYLLKDRVADVADFVAALRRVARGTALDPEVVAQLLLRRKSDPATRLTRWERDVLALMAEGRSDRDIATALVVSDSAAFPGTFSRTRSLSGSAWKVARSTAARRLGALVAGEAELGVSGDDEPSPPVRGARAGSLSLDPPTEFG